MASFAGWTPDAVSLVERSIAAHGGERLWRSTASIRIGVQSSSGLLLRLKGYPEKFPAPPAFEVFPHECRTIFVGYPKPGERGFFSRGDVRIEDAAGSGIRLESRDHRRTFAGIRKLRRWTPLDALYFFGYALWHYHTLPFTLGTAHLNRVMKRRGISAGVDVTFGADIQTHCRRQQFYFGTDGRIIRHDYVAEVIGPMARGAHFWEKYDDSTGLAIARLRRVVVRLGGHATLLEVLRVQMGKGESLGAA